MKDERDFPMLDGPPIPHWFAEAIYEVYCAYISQSQGLAQIAARGGFAYEEIRPFMERRQKLLAERTAIRERK